MWVIDTSPSPSPKRCGENGGTRGFHPSPLGEGPGGEGKHITHIASLPVSEPRNLVSFALSFALR